MILADDINIFVANIKQNNMAQFEIKDGVAIIPEGTIEIKPGAFTVCI